jgi:GTPase SAR1 family protein
MPLLECLSICDVDVVGDTGDGNVIDWLPVFVHSLVRDTTQPQNVAKPGLLQELIIKNCKLTPTLYYPSMRFPLGIVKIDFSCNPELALSGVAYLLAAVRNKNAARSLSFSRCTLESNVGVVADSHMQMIIAAFQKLTSLDHLDFSFNFFSIPQCLGIVNSLPTSITTLQLCGIQFLNDFNSFASVLRDCFGRLGPSLRHLSLSFNDTFVSFPPSVSLCEHLYYLDISYCNHLKFIPHEVFVAALSVLIACHNPSLEGICLQPGRSSNLKFVDLSYCSSLQTLPDEIYVPSLEVMLLSYNAALKNVAKAGCGILNAVGLKFIDLTSCVLLSSLPDELADDRLAQLNSIIIDGCTNMVYPPYKAMHNKTQNIKDYLKAAKDQPPLKRVKVVLLGNGRCGKTSLLGSLAQRELDPNCPSTRCVQVDVFSKKLQTESWLKKSAMFVGADVSRFAPEMSYWDFPGQLEYSATHDFFMSSRQAVYVIVFSVCDHPAAQQDQVRYWLNTILARYSNQIRVIIVGTKVDILDSQLQCPGAGDISMLRKAALEHCKLAIRQSVETIISYHNLTFTIPILFASSNKTHALWKEQQKEIKAQISKFSEDIFRHCEGQLRFPKAHMKLFDEIQALSKCHPQKPVFSLNDECITTRFKLLYALRGAPDGRSLQSLDILSDVGLLVHYKCKGQDYVCPTPQYVANIISLLAGV